MILQKYIEKLMQKLSILLLSLVILGCQKSGIEQNNRKEILFSTNEIKTKSSVYGDVSVDNFGVYGYYMSNRFIRNGEYDSNGYPTNESYYWPYMESGSTVSFIAYSPYTTNVSDNNNEISLPINSLSLSSNDFEDVMYARTSVSRVMERVPLDFKHAMSWIQFQGKYDTLTLDSVEITSICFGTNLCTQANLILNISDTSTYWDNISSPVSIDFAQMNRSVSDTAFVTLSNTFIIPQSVPSSVTITLNEKISGDNGSQAIHYNGRTIVKDLSEILTTFEAGKKYVFKYYISANNIDFTIDTDDWSNPADTLWESWTHTSDAYVERYFCRNLAPNGQKFMYGAKGLNFENGDFVEAKLDLSPLNRIKQNIFSVGEDLKTWNTGNDRTYNFHAYFPNANGDRRLRFSAVIGEKVNGLTRRTMGIVNFDIQDETSVIIRFDKYGFYVNGVLVTAGDFEIVDDRPGDTYPDYFMQHFNNGPLNIQFGSMEGSTRSYAIYDYIMYHHNLNNE